MDSVPKEMVARWEAFAKRANVLPWIWNPGNYCQ